MLTVLAILGVLVVLFLAGALATREDAALAPAVRDAADLDLPQAGPVRGADLRRVRFGLALRGYRMSEVDAVLARVADELEDRDLRLGDAPSDISTTSPAAPEPETAHGHDVGTGEDAGTREAAADGAAPHEPGAPEVGPALVPPAASLPATDPALGPDEPARPVGHAHDGDALPG